MRLLQIQLPLDGGGPVALDLHPMMTVVSGLDTGARERLVEIIRDLPSGRDPGLGGLVEAHGVLFDLSSETLGLFDLHTDLDAVVRRTDLPGGSAPAPVARASTEQFLAATPEGVYPELDVARRRQRSARETLSILREAAERSRTEH